jgi:hypothetical protein
MAEKVPFYVPKPDQKYSILKNGIGVDSDTTRLSTRIVNPDNQLLTEISRTDGTPITTTIKHLLDKNIDFNFSVSPGSYIDWNNSVIEMRDKLAYDNGTTAIAAVNAANLLIPWNLTFWKFDEVHVSINGTEVFTKTAGDYCATQTMKMVMEHSKESLSASTAVYGPVGDEQYYHGLATGAITGNDNSIRRDSNWITTNYDQEVVKQPTFKDLFFSIPGLSNNMRNIKISFKVKTSIPLVKINATGGGAVYPQSFKIVLHEYNFAPSSASTGLSDKMSGIEDHIAFVDVETRKLPYSSDLVVNNQKNIQWVAATQFAYEVDNTYTNAQTYQSPSQTMLLNGYSSAATTTGNLLIRTDGINGVARVAPPSSVQAEIGGITYPNNAISLINKGYGYMLDTSELYREYCIACGKASPAIDEVYFKRTMPFFVVKPFAGNKLVQSSDIVVRMPGFSAPAGNTGAVAAQVRIIYGKLKGYTIAPSGVVSEAISSF